jgi:hypothetical protein
VVVNIKNDLYMNIDEVLESLIFVNEYAEFYSCNEINPYIH